MAGYYSEAEFTSPSLAPPQGTVWMWYDYNVGSVGWAKIPHEDNNSLPLKKAIRAINEFYLQLTNPRDVNGLILDNSNQKWVIDSIKGYPDYGYTLFKIQIDISSTAVSSDEAGSSGGIGFNFQASGDLSFPASSSGDSLNPVLTTGISSSIPQGFFPNTTTYPTEQFFRGYNGADYFKEYQVFSNIGGSITDPSNNFNNGQTEINNSNLSSVTIKAPSNRVPWFMNAPFETITFSESAITDLSPNDRTELNELVGFYLSNTGLSSTSTLTEICNNGDFSNASGGKIGIVSASPLLEEENGLLKFRQGSAGQTTSTEEALRQVGGGISYSSKSIIKNGTLDLISEGNYAVKTGTNGGSVNNDKKIVLIRERNIVGLYHCPSKQKDVRPEFIFYASQVDDAGDGDSLVNIGDIRGVHLATINNQAGFLLGAFGDVGTGGTTQNVLTPTDVSLLPGLSEGYEGGKAIISSTTDTSLALGAFYTTFVNNQYYVYASLLSGVLIGGKIANPAPPATYSFRLQGTGISTPITFSGVFTQINNRESTNATGMNITNQVSTNPLISGGTYTLTVTGKK